MKELDEIDHLFQETFDGFEVIPDPLVKEKIDQSLASGKRRRRFLLIFFPLTVLSMTVVAIGMLYLPSDKQIAVVQNPTKESPGQQVSQTSQEKSSITMGVNSDEVIQSPTDVKISNRMESDNRQLRTTEKNYKKKNHQFLKEQQVTVIEKNSITDVVVFLPESKDADTTTGITADTIPDSSEVQSSESIVKQDEHEPLKIIEKTEAASRWSVTAFTGWEGERAKSFESLNNNDLSNVGREFAGIRSSSFYGKIEINYTLPVGLDLIAGLGFRSTEVSQQAIHYMLDSLPAYEDITTSAPTSYTYFAREDQGQQIFRVNSLIMPIGIAGSLAVGRSFVLRCSAGTEFSYGWFNNVQLQSGFSRPVFRPFGWNVWVRPELHYPIGRWRLIAYGAFNQVLYQQLKWEVTSSKRNPLFGVGIGASIRL